MLFKTTCWINNQNLAAEKKISPRHDFTRKTKKRKCEQQEKLQKNESEIPSISSFDYKKHKYYTNMKRKKRKTITVQLNEF